MYEVCLFLALVLIVLIFACYYMWRPGTVSTSTITPCGYKQEETNTAEKHGVSRVQLTKKRTRQETKKGFQYGTLHRLDMLMSSDRNPPRPSGIPRGDRVDFRTAYNHGGFRDIQARVSTGLQNAVRNQNSSGYLPIPQSDIEHQPNEMAGTR